MAAGPNGQTSRARRPQQRCSAAPSRRRQLPGRHDLLQRRARSRVAPRLRWRPVQPLHGMLAEPAAALLGFDAGTGVAHWRTGLPLGFDAGRASMRTGERWRFRHFPATSAASGRMATMPRALCAPRCGAFGEGDLGTGVPATCGAPDGRCAALKHPRLRWACPSLGRPASRAMLCGARWRR